MIAKLIVPYPKFLTAVILLYLVNYFNSSNLLFISTIKMIRFLKNRILIAIKCEKFHKKFRHCLPKQESNVRKCRDLSKILSRLEIRHDRVIIAEC